MSTFLKNLQQRFSRTRYLIGSAETALIEVGGRAREWIVSRELCLYTQIDCGHIPAKRRPGFVKIAVRRLAPFPDPECHVVWLPDSAMVWIWSRTRTFVERDQMPLRNDDDAILPESVLLGSAQTEGALLQANSSGCEGRVWHQGRMVASRWWSQAPDLAEWSSFCRSAGMPACVDVPEPASFQLRPEPWSGETAPSLGRWMVAARRPLLVSAAALLAAAFAWDLGALARVHLARASLSRESARLEQKLAGVLQARDLANRDAAAADALLALRPPTAQIHLMAEVSKLLSNEHAQLMSWNVTDGDQLAVTMRIANPDTVSLVQRFEQSGLVRGVTSESGASGEVTLRGTIQPDSLSRERS